MHNIAVCCWLFWWLFVSVFIALAITVSVSSTHYSLPWLWHSSRVDTSLINLITSTEITWKVAHLITWQHAFIDLPLTHCLQSIFLPTNTIRLAYADNECPEPLQYCSVISVLTNYCGENCKASRCGLLFSDVFPQLWHVRYHHKVKQVPGKSQLHGHGVYP